jgi:hypothetical protein
VWGAGGGGRGYSSDSPEYGGGGGGYSKYETPVVASSTTFGYYVGTGGTGSVNGTGNSLRGTDGGSSYANGVFDQGTIYAYGGKGGAQAASTANSAGGYGGQKLGQHIKLSTSTRGANGTTTVGGSGASGGSGGATSGAAGSAPGGGGAPGLSSGVYGGNGAAGQVKFTWYGASSVNNLRSFIRGGSYNPSPGAVGYNGIIPDSGTLRIRDFLGADEVGYNGNTYHALLSNYICYASDNSEFGGSASATATLDISATGISSPELPAYVSPSYFSEIFPQTWLRRWTSNADSTLSSYFDVIFTKTAGTTPSGSAVNTWIQCSTGPSWSLTASVSGDGYELKSCSGTLQIRRRSDSVVIVSVASEITAEAQSTTPPCPTCCFTPETLITMADGSTKPIVMVTTGEWIMVRGGTKQVTEIITRTNRVMYQIQFADGRVLNASEDHPLYVVDKGYAAINPGVGGNYKDLGIPDQLYVGDLVLDSDGRENQIVSITDLDYPETVYTFAESEFYANGMLVY